MAEGRELWLTISGAQFLPGDGEEDPGPGAAGEPLVTRMQVAAMYYRRNGSHYLLYEEQSEGCPAPVKSRVKFRQGYLELTRQGAMGCHMIFEQGKSHRTEYATPYGGLTLEITTKRIRLEQGETDSGDCPAVTVEYSLENEGQLIGNYQLRLQSEKREV